MGYYSEQVAAYQRTISDALAGKRLRQSIRQLQDRSKISNSLKAKLPPVKTTGGLSSKRVKGDIGGSGTGGDFVEISRNFYSTLRELRSSDGLFVLQYYNVRQIIMDRGTFTYLDYDPDA